MQELEPEALWGFQSLARIGTNHKNLIVMDINMEKILNDDSPYEMCMLALAYASRLQIELSDLLSTMDNPTKADT